MIFLWEGSAKRRSNEWRWRKRWNARREHSLMNHVEKEFEGGWEKTQGEEIACGCNIAGQQNASKTILIKSPGWWDCILPQSSQTIFRFCVLSCLLNSCVCAGIICVNVKLDTIKEEMELQKTSIYDWWVVVLFIAVWDIVAVGC